MTDEPDDSELARARARRDAEAKVENARREQEALARRAQRSGAGKPQRLSASVGNLSREIADAMPGTANWTAEDWERHDARVRESIERDRIAALEERRHERRRFLASEEGGNHSDALMRFVLCPAFKVDQQLVPLLGDASGRGGWWLGGIALLWGGIGRGKTSAAMRWLLCHPAQTGGFIRASALLGVSRSTDEGKEIRGRWKGVGALVLDDLGTESLDERRGDRVAYLEEVVDHFIDTKRSLLITTNIPQHARQAWRDRYGLRIESRLDTASWIKLEGPDRRTPGGKP